MSSEIPSATPRATGAPNSSSPGNVRVGFVGLGHLGQHLAASLLNAGYPLTITDLQRTLGESLLANGAKWAATASEVAQNSDVVFTCLPSPAAINAVVTGPTGILAGFVAAAATTSAGSANATTGGTTTTNASPQTWIDMSTNDRNETLRLAELARESNVVMLEAPVTGGVHRAAAGQVTVLVGGNELIAERYRPLLEAVGNPVLYMGELGSAALIKVITNMLAFINLVGVGEALMLAKQGGIDLGKAFEAIKESSGNSFVHETESQVILNGSYNINFTMDLACKDLGFATQFGRELGVPLDIAGLVEQTFIRARAQYGGSAWSSQVVKLLEDAVGADLRAPGFPEELPPS
jgi:3-hydroxyisobutyrate dehydrogenase